MMSWRRSVVKNLGCWHLTYKEFAKYFRCTRHHSVVSIVIFLFGKHIMITEQKNSNLIDILNVEQFYWRLMRLHIQWATTRGDFYLGIGVMFCKDKEVGSGTNTHYPFLRQNMVSSTNLHYIKQCFCLWDIFILYLIVFPS